MPTKTTQKAKKKINVESSPAIRETLKGLSIEFALSSFKLDPTAFYEFMMHRALATLIEGGFIKLTSKAIAKKGENSNAKKQAKAKSVRK